MISSKYREKISWIIEYIADIVAFNVNPNVVTALGFIFSTISAIFFIQKNLLLALIFLILSSLSDALDGAIARKLGRTTKFGAFFDAVLDRYSDGVIILGVGIYIENLVLALLALIGFYMVSYTRARAELFIDKCDVGIAERAERLIILIFGTLLEILGFSILYYTVVVLAILSHLTALHRILYTYKKLK